MTPNEWDEILGWMEARWPDLTWTAATCRALFDELSPLHAIDVWAAVSSLFDEGNDFLRPAMLVHRAREAAKLSADKERRGLPPAAREPLDLRAWLASEGCASLWDLVRKEHRSQVRHGTRRHEPCALCVDESQPRSRNQMMLDELAR